ncbi:glycosyltransferase [Vagococcus fluvialis]|uniref:glycosyltransferase n=1 Tax=Vagococcus fluvialis TaxID=2738 RepID=UPI001A8ED513|nr:glycosyltransferase [Vagococcus fluvialis]MBO0429802.1 glycosyltransferase [Vagococcus fluvialis]
MKFGIGVILYNPDRLVLERLKKYKMLTSNLFIVDNTEEENCISDEVKSTFLNYYRFKENEGMSNALNKIFSESLKKNIEWLLTMDQDSDFSSESINSMLEVINQNKNSEISIFCPNYRKIYIDSNGDDVFGKYAIKENEIINVNFSMTSGSFCRMSDIEKNLPLENLFIGYVDNDLCLTLLSQNKKICMVGNIGFSQRVGAEVKSTLYNRVFRIVKHTEQRYYYMTRNNCYLQEKYKSNRKFKKILILNFLRIHINILLGENNKIKKLKSSYKGYMDYKNDELGKKI